jgi:hypothetical protein
MSVFFMLGCGGAGTSSDAERPALPIQFGAAAPAPLVLWLESIDRARPRDAVPMRLILENRGEVPTEIGLGGNPIAFDMLVLTPEGSVVWKRLEGVAIDAILHSRTLRPGERMEFNEVWMQRDNAGRRVPPGSYLLRGVLPVVGFDGGWVTEARPLTILP